MPFTLAHPAAVIPLHRALGSAGVLSALIIGSIVPDMPYFVPVGISRTATHSLAGLLWFCAPVGLVSYLLFHMLIRPLGYYLLPFCVQSRLRPPGSSWFPTAPMWAVLVSLVLGGATHILWDAFTHEDGFVVEMVPALQVLLWEVGGYPVFVYKLLQHGSSLIGCVLLARWGWQWFRSASGHYAPRGWQFPATARVPMLCVLLAAPALGGLFSGVWHMGSATGMRALQQFMVHGVITALSVFGATLLGFGVIWRLWDMRDRPQSDLPQASSGHERRESPLHW